MGVSVQQRPSALPAAPRSEVGPESVPERNNSDVLQEVFGSGVPAMEEDSWLLRPPSEHGGGRDAGKTMAIGQDNTGLKRRAYSELLARGINKGGDYHDLEIYLYPSCLDRKGQFDCDSVTIHLSNSGEEQARIHNADPDSRRIYLPMTDIAAVSRLLNELVRGPSDGNYSVRRMVVGGGHGYRRDGLMTVDMGNQYMNTGNVPEKQRDLLGLKWTRDAELEFLQCSLGKDQELLLRLQRMFSGGKATAGATKRITDITERGINTSNEGNAGYVELPKDPFSGLP